MAEKENSLDKIRKKRRIFRVIATIAILYLGIQAISVQMQSKENQATLDQLEAETTAQTTLNAEYENLLEKGNDPDYMEKRARDDKSLQMVYPGEQVFYDTTDD